MNISIRPLAAALALAGLFVAQTVSAAPLTLTDGDQIKLYNNGTLGANGDSWGGGEFLATGVSGHVAQGPGDPFFTFCVEDSETFSPGTAYYVKINTGAVGGGLSSAGTYTGDTNGTAGFDPLSTATAWLYTQFITNPTALGYDMSGGNIQTTGTHNQMLDSAMQLAIWHLEGELAGAALTAYDTNVTTAGTLGYTAHKFVHDAIDAGWTNIGNVRVLNLYSSYNSGTGQFSNNHQDQLYLVPEPASVALLGLGLAGLAFARRRVRKAA